MSAIDNFNAEAAICRSTVSVLQAQRNSSPGQWGLRGWEVKSNDACAYDAVSLTAKVTGSWRGSPYANRGEFARAIQAGIEACRLQIIDAAIAHCNAREAQAAAYAVAEAKQVLKAAGAS